MRRSESITYRSTLMPSACYATLSAVNSDTSRAISPGRSRIAKWQHWPSICSRDPRTQACSRYAHYATCHRFPEQAHRGLLGDHRNDGDADAHVFTAAFARDRAEGYAE